MKDRKCSEYDVLFTYVIHFDSPVDCGKFELYGNTTHYVGKSKQIEHRILQHITGYGSAVTRNAFEKGIRARLVYMVYGDKEKEVTKNVKLGKFNCPACVRKTYVDICKVEDIVP